VKFYGIFQQENIILLFLLKVYLRFVTVTSLTSGIEVRFSFQIEYQCCHCCQYL